MDKTCSMRATFLKYRKPNHQRKLNKSNRKTIQGLLQKVSSIFQLVPSIFSHPVFVPVEVVQGGAPHSLRKRRISQKFQGFPRTASSKWQHRDSISLLYLLSVYFYANNPARGQLQVLISITFKKTCFG